MLSYIVAMSNIEQTLFDRLGGVRPMAKLVGRAPSTVQSWKTEGRIPAHDQPNVIEKARAAGHDINADDVVYPMGKPATVELGQ